MLYLDKSSTDNDDLKADVKLLNSDTFVDGFIQFHISVDFNDAYNYYKFIVDV